MYLGGDWTNNSQFDAKGGVVVFNGIGKQNIISASEETFKNFIVCVDGDLVLNKSVIVTGELVLIQGLVLYWRKQVDARERDGGHAVENGRTYRWQLHPLHP